MLAHQQALEGRQRETWRLQLEELVRENQVLSLKLKEEAAWAEQRTRQLQQDLVALEADSRKIEYEASRQRDELEKKLRSALACSVSNETMLALHNNDWAQRLSLWNRRALAAEAEIERLEERRKPGQGPVLDGFQRLESGSTSRGGTLSASWSRVELSGQLTHLRGDGVLVEDDEDGWLYAKGGEPIAMTWDLVGMILDVAAWGPGRYFIFPLVLE